MEVKSLNYKKKMCRWYNTKYSNGYFQQSSFISPYLDLVFFTCVHGTILSQKYFGKNNESTKKLKT